MLSHQGTQNNNSLGQLAGAEARAVTPRSLTLILRGK